MAPLRSQEPTGAMESLRTPPFLAGNSHPGRRQRIVQRLMEAQTVTVIVELSEQEMTEILELTGERKKGPAIRRLMEEALKQQRVGSGAGDL
jgi:hypothetical protein